MKINGDIDTRINRVVSLSMTADSFADERLLTAIVDAFKSLEQSSLVVIVGSKKFTWTGQPEPRE